MPPSDAIHAFALRQFLLDGQEVEYRLIRSKAARKLRIKVKPDGSIDVIVPEGRDDQEAITFVAENQAWVIEQLERARQLRAIRRPGKQIRGQVLLRGTPVPVNVVRSEVWLAPSKVVLENGAISITCGPGTRTPVARSLENWLRKLARETIARHVADIGSRVKRTPTRVYIMGQRTKWGNCSALGNLSFNWRLVMAPDYVLRYIVTHEMVHLAIPDHSRRFWMTVQSLCPDTEKARQWLVSNSDQLFVDLSLVVQS